MMLCLSAEGIWPCSRATLNSGKTRTESSFQPSAAAQDLLAGLLDGGDARVDEVRLLAGLEPLADEFVGLLGRCCGSTSRVTIAAAAGRALLDDRDVQVAERRHRQRPRDGRGGHHQAVGRAVLAQLGPLVDAELVLLVDHDQAQVVELDILLQQRDRADDDVDLAGGLICVRMSSRFVPVRPPVIRTRRTWLSLRYRSMLR